MVELGSISKVFCIVKFFLLIEYDPYTIKKGECKSPCFHFIICVTFMLHYLPFLLSLRKPCKYLGTPASFFFNQVLYFFFNLRNILGSERILDCLFSGFHLTWLVISEPLIVKPLLSRTALQVISNISH